MYATIGNPAICLTLYLTGVHFRCELQHVGQLCKQKIKCQPIRTREIAGVRLQEELNVLQRTVSNILILVHFFMCLTTLPTLLPQPSHRFEFDPLLTLISPDNNMASLINVLKF